MDAEEVSLMVYQWAWRQAEQDVSLEYALGNLGSIVPANHGFATAPYEGQVRQAYSDQQSMRDSGWRSRFDRPVMANQFMADPATNQFVPDASGSTGMDDTTRPSFQPQTTRPRGGEADMSKPDSNSTGNDATNVQQGFMGSLIPVICTDCFTTARVASVSADLKCASCGGDDLDLDLRAEAAAIPTGRSEYKPGQARMSEPTPQTHPDQFSNEDILAEVKYLMRTNKQYGSNPIRTMKYMDLMKIISDREAATASLHTTAAIGSGAGYYVLSRGIPIDGPFATVVEARNALPGKIGDAVEYLTENNAASVSGRGQLQSFPNPSGWKGQSEVRGFSGSGGPSIAYDMSLWAAKTAKVAEIVDGIQVTNPSLPRREAMRIAWSTVKNFPSIVQEQD